ncbi:hypothetical protein H0H87_006958 [Tephrocybe sp. NHM501043]|nr:hypothetical protein H0H87_006958 [Tephrocybe sp. NHM501043]
MSLSDDTLRKILVQIQTTAIQSQRAFQVTQQQASAKDRERRILQLTIDEINQIEEDVNLYKGVGKMFMHVPRKTMEAELKSQEKELSDDISGLAKKSKYLEKQFNDAQAQLRDISLGSYDRSANAFKTALSCLPTTSELSDADKTLKAQYEDYLKDAEANMRREFKVDHVTIPNDSGDVPWKRAMAMDPILIAEGKIQHSVCSKIGFPSHV